MSPLYEYRCGEGHREERLRRYEDRTDPVRCECCGTAMQPLFPVPHVAPDGVYSYEPNIGSADAFERKRNSLKEPPR